MAEVTIEVFDKESDAVDFVNLMRSDGCNTAITETASATTLRYVVDGKSVSIKIKGDGSNFAVMAFRGPILCQPPTI